MKLVERLAIDIKEWPEGADGASPSAFEGRQVYFYGECGDGFDYFLDEAVDDFKDRIWVTKQEWQAARTAYLSSIQPARDPEIAAITDRVYGQLEAIESVSYEQELWDKAALTSLSAAMNVYSDDATEVQIIYCFEYADAFMAERAKRLKGGV